MQGKGSKKSPAVTRDMLKNGQPHKVKQSFPSSQTSRAVIAEKEPFSAGTSFDTAIVLSSPPPTKASRTSTFLQTTLDTFVPAFQTAINTMAGPKQVQARIRPLDILLRSLPPEIRLLIYSYLFEGSRLRLDFNGQPPINSRGKFVLKSVGLSEILNSTHNHKAALLLMSKFYKNEAFDVLASLTIVEFEGGEDERQDMLAGIDRDFLQHVQCLQVHPNTLIRTDRNLLTGLKEVTLSVENPYSMALAARTKDQFIHCMFCNACGSMDGQWYYDSFAIEEMDWDWKRKQLLYLAQESGWTMKFLLYSNLDEPALFGPPDLRLEHEYNLDTQKLVRRRLLHQDKVVACDKDFATIGRFREAINAQPIDWVVDSDYDSDLYD